MKKFHQCVLLHYPQLWNLRAHIVLPVIALLHIMFYISGYTSFTVGERLHMRSGADDHFVDASIAFSILLSVLILLLWLVYYLRNNAFKSFYPVKRWYIAVEFAITFTVILSGISFFESYACGFWRSLRTHTAEIDVPAESRILALAYGLIPSEEGLYNSHSTCDSLQYTDSLEAVSMALRARADSLRGDTHNDYTTVTYETPPRRANEYKLKGIPPQAQLAQVDSELDAFRERDQLDKVYSRLFYCHCYYSSDSLHDRQWVSSELSTMLVRRDRAAVSHVLLAFDSMCAKYEINKTIDVRSQVNDIFRDTTYRLYPKDFISDNVSTERPYLLFDDVSTSLSTIDHSRMRSFDFEFWLCMCYLAYGGGLLLLSYRLSARKPWFIALVGTGVWLILLGLSMIWIRGEQGLWIELLVLAGAFFAGHIGLRSIVRRTLAGVLLIWWTWSLPFLGALIIEFVKWNCFQHVYNAEPAAGWLWINENYLWLQLAYLVLSMIYSSTLLGGLYRRWQAMPEE